MLIVMVPGGFRGFFRDSAEAEKNGDPDAYAAVSERFGITSL